MELLGGRLNFEEMVELLDKRLNDKGKNWKHVYKVRLQSSHSSYIYLVARFW